MGAPSLDFRGSLDLRQQSGPAHGGAGLSSGRRRSRKTVKSPPKRAIESIIGLSQETFAASVFAAQGARHFADPATPPRERKQLLYTALGLDRWSG